MTLKEIIDIITAVGTIVTTIVAIYLAYVNYKSNKQNQINSLINTLEQNGYSNIMQLFECAKKSKNDRKYILNSMIEWMVDLSNKHDFRRVISPDNPILSKAYHDIMETQKIIFSEVFIEYEKNLGCFIFPEIKGKYFSNILLNYTKFDTNFIYKRIVFDELKYNITNQSFQVEVINIKNFLSGTNIFIRFNNKTSLSINKAILGNNKTPETYISYLNYEEKLNKLNIDINLMNIVDIFKAVNNIKPKKCILLITSLNNKYISHEINLIFANNKFYINKDDIVRTNLLKNIPDEYILNN